MEDIDAIDKERLILIKDKIYDVSSSLQETFDIKTHFNEHSANIIFLTENPDPVEISIIFKKKFYSKNKALSFEYFLKKDRKERIKLIDEFIKNKT